MIKVILPKERVRRPDSLEYTDSMNYIDFECSCGNCMDGIRKNGTESVTFNYEGDHETYRVDQLVVVTFDDYPTSWETDYTSSTDEIKILEVKDFTVSDFDRIQTKLNDEWYYNILSD